MSEVGIYKRKNFRENIQKHAFKKKIKIYAIDQERNKF